MSQKMPWSLSLQTRATVGELLQVLGSSPPKPSLLPRLGRLSLASTQTSLEKRWKDEHQGALSCGGQAWTTILKPQRSPPPNQGSFQRVSFPRGGNIPERKGSPLEQNSEEEEKEKKPLWLPGPLSLTLAHGNFDHWPPALSSPASGSGSPTWTRPVTLALFFFQHGPSRGWGTLAVCRSTLCLLGILGGFPKWRQQLGSCGFNTWGMWRIHPAAST